MNRCLICSKHSTAVCGVLIWRGLQRGPRVISVETARLRSMWNVIVSWSSAPGMEIEAASLCQRDVDPSAKNEMFHAYWNVRKRKKKLAWHSQLGLGVPVEHKQFHKTPTSDWLWRIKTKLEHSIIMLNTKHVHCPSHNQTSHFPANKSTTSLPISLAWYKFFFFFLAWYQLFITYWLCKDASL